MDVFRVCCKYFFKKTILCVISIDQKQVQQTDLHSTPPSSEDKHRCDVVWSFFLWTRREFRPLMSSSFICGVMKSTKNMNVEQKRKVYKFPWQISIQNLIVCAKFC